MTEIEKVDGLRVSTWFTLLVDPGVRVLSVSGTYLGLWGGRETGRVELKATVKAGHRYQVKAVRHGDLMTLWLEDEATQEVVSGKQSTHTTHWVKWL